MIIVRSGDLKPYQEVIRGIREAGNCTVREMALRAGDGQDEILAKSPDIIVAIGTSAFKKVRTVNNVPVVYAMAMPSEVESSREPNISGVSMDVSPARYVSAIRDLFPGAARIGILYDPRHTGAFFEEAAKRARAAGMEVVSRQVQNSSKISAALTGMHGAIDVFLMLPDPTVVTAENVELLLRFSFQQAVPVLTFSRKYVEMGAFASLDTDPYDMGLQAGEMANRLVRSKQDALREYARTSSLSVNTNVAAKMGFRIRAEILKKVMRIE
jgi:putative ABC transport system substrate-binding protein